MSNSLAAPVAIGLAVGIGFMLLLNVAIDQNLSSIPTVPTLTEDEAIEVTKADIKQRVGDNVIVRLYERDSRDTDNVNRPLLLVYYDQHKDLVHNINGTSHTISSSCTPSLDCLNVHNRGLDEVLAGRLVYIVDGAYSGEEKSSPAYYFIDAMNGEVLWSYIGEDLYPELNKPRISQYDAIRIVEGDFKTRQNDHDRITGIIINQTSGYVPFKEFTEKNLRLPLVYVHPNGTLFRIAASDYEILGQCNSGLHAYCGFLEPYNFGYNGRLVYGVEVLLWDRDPGDDSRGFPFLYIVDAVNSKIVDSTFLRDEKIRNMRNGE